MHAYSKCAFQLNPQREIPVLDDNGFLISEHIAIMQYLCDKYAPESQAYPKEPQLRALINHRLCYNMAHFYSAVAPYTLAPIFFEVRLSIPILLSTLMTPFHSIPEMTTAPNEWKALWECSKNICDESAKSSSSPIMSRLRTSHSSLRWSALKVSGTRSASTLWSRNGTTTSSSRARKNGLSLKKV